MGKPTKEIWDKQNPSCMSCGWSPAFYEVKDSLVRDEGEDSEDSICFTAPCTQDDSHRGYYLYIRKEIK